VLVMYHSAEWAQRISSLTSLGTGGLLWLMWSGLTCVPFAALICVMALERGWISRALSWSPLVLLGETSYSVYLIHWILLYSYVARPSLFPAVPDRFLLVMFWVILLLASYLCWTFVEVPCRNTIVRLWDRRFSRDRRADAGASITTPHRLRPPITTPTLQRGCAAAAILVAIASLFALAQPLLQMPLDAPPPLASLVPVAGPGMTTVDAIGGRPAVAGAPIARRDHPDRALRVAGWSVDPARHTPVRAVYLCVDDGLDIPATYGLSRPDVAGALGNDDAANSGFSGAIPLGKLADGPHTLTIKALSREGATYTTSAPIPFVITSP
jgi:hypothetical protein